MGHVGGDFTSVTPVLSCVNEIHVAKRVGKCVQESPPTPRGRVVERLLLLRGRERPIAFPRQPTRGKVVFAEESPSLVGELVTCVGGMTVISVTIFRILRDIIRIGDFAFRSKLDTG